MIVSKKRSENTRFAKLNAKSKQSSWLYKSFESEIAIQSFSKRWETINNWMMIPALIPNVVYFNRVLRMKSSTEWIKNKHVNRIYLALWLRLKDYRNTKTVQALKLTKSTLDSYTYHIYRVIQTHTKDT